MFQNDIINNKILRDGKIIYSNILTTTKIADSTVPAPPPRKCGDTLW